MAAFHDLDPRILRVWRIAAAIPLVPLIGATIVAGVVTGRWWVWVLGIVVTALVAVSAWLIPAAQYRRWSYALRDYDLVLRSGVVVHVERMVPRTRIQHVDLVEGALDRWLGLAKLLIFTAGSASADVVVPGLARPTAEQLRDDLLSWVDESGPAPRRELVDDSMPEDEPLQGSASEGPPTLPFEGDGPRLPDWYEPD